MELIVRHRDREEQVHLERTPNGYRIQLGEATYEVDVATFDPSVRSLILDGKQYEVATHDKGDGKFLVSTQAGEEIVHLMDPLTHLALQSSGGLGGAGSQQVTAYMPGRVVKVMVEEGQEVEAGQGLVVLEAMKMENEIQAEVAGVVRKVFVQEGQAVDGGDPMFEIS